jgi:hypothetical protein
MNNIKGGAQIMEKNNTSQKRLTEMSTKAG